MATPVIMPRLGQSVETCIITSWLKKKGEQVSTGDILFSYETDKAAFDMEAPTDGILLDVFYNEGDEVPVLTNVAVIGAAGEKTEAFRPSGKPTETKVEEYPVTESAIEQRDDIGAANISGEKIRISPRAKVLANDKGVDIYSITGTGPAGRIVVADIERAASGDRLQASGDRLQASGDRQQAPGTERLTPDASRLTPDAGYTDQPLSNVRKLISKAMHSSLQNSAQLTHHMSADARRLLEARKKVKEKVVKDKNASDITINDMVCRCVINALKKFPVMNSHFLDDRIRTFSNVHLGLAVDTPRGLMVATVRNADTFDIFRLSAELKSIADACRKGNIDPELLKSTAASFTVSNLGNYGVEMFTPVINLPQAGILGVCTIINRPAELGNGIFGFLPVMGLSLTYDHRAVDGGPATLFLKEIKEQIENFKY